MSHVVSDDSYLGLGGSHEGHLTRRAGRRANSDRIRQGAGFGPQALVG